MESLYSAIDTAILENRNIVVYRNPGENTLHFVGAEDEEVEFFYKTEDLNGVDGYIIAPFTVTGRCPIVCMHGKETAWELPEDFFTNESSGYPEIPSISPRYKKRFHKFMAPLLYNDLDKIVLSRELKIERPEGFSPAKTFIKACKRYNRSYVYLFHSATTGTWIGSTPEILLSGEKESWRTIALAGTQPLVKGVLPMVWSEKNFQEQGMVADFIQQQLKAVGINAEQSGPYAVKAGELSHLRTDFDFAIPDTQYIGDLLKLLYPTPAVCGLPKKNACWFIMDNEGYNRQYYSGFLGWLRPEGKTALYVNLRCLEAREKILTLFSGSGLLVNSTVDEEWQETEEKMWTMKAILK
ncbi:MAG: isochorismate synthase [Tannerellaceae bacterium]|jgi:isochorismate synthase|nr:isochorismate synthase [Tannerellaceae bacterium]